MGLWAAHLLVSPSSPPPLIFLPPPPHIFLRREKLRNLWTQEMGNETVRPRNQTCSDGDTVKWKGPPWTLNTSPPLPLPGCGPSAPEVLFLGREDSVRPGVVSPGSRKPWTQTEPVLFLPASRPTPPLCPMCPGCLRRLDQTLPAGS